MTTMPKYFSEFISILAGIFIATLGIKGFLLPNNFIDGGVTGVSMLVSSIFELDLGLIILLINTPFVLIGVKQISWKFALRSTLAIVGLAIAVHFIYFPALTTDKLLSSVFGGIAVGAGIGFAFRGRAVLDGTEIVAIILSKRLGIKVGDIILIFNIIIFAVAAFFLGIESALYSVLTYMAASKAIDFLVYGFDFLGVSIVSKHSERVRDALVSELGVGVTLYSGKNGFSNEEQEILMCVCTRFDSQKIKSVVLEIDPAAFMTIHKITDTYGGMLKRPKHLQ